MELLVDIFLGCFFVANGFLVKKYPGLIAGYNTMSSKAKESFDINGFSSLMKKAFIIAGILLTSSTEVCRLADWELGRAIAIVAISIGCCIFMMINCYRFKNRS